MLLEVVLLNRLCLCNLFRPLLAVTRATAAQAIHEDRRAGGFLAAENAVFTAPLQQLSERSLARCSLCGLVVFVLRNGAVLVEKVVGPVVCLLMESFASRGEVEEIGGDCRGAWIRVVGLVWDMGGVQVGSDQLCDFWRKRSEVVAHVVVIVAVGEVVTSHAGRYCHPVLLG